MFDRKTWENEPSTSTPLNAEGLNDLEGRVESGLLEDRANGLFVGSYFPNNSWTELHLAVSADGKSWLPLGRPNYASYNVRDPSIMRFDERWNVAYTTQNAPYNAIGIVWGDTLRTIGAGELIVDSTVVPDFAGFAYVWAPEWFEDSDGTLYLIISGKPTANMDTPDWQPYLLPILDRNFANSPATFGALIPLTGLGTSVIDPSIIKIGSEYHVFSKEHVHTLHQNSRIEHYKETGATVVAANTAGWNPVHVDDQLLGATGSVEAPNIVHLGGTNYRLYFDPHQLAGVLRYVDSTDNCATFGAIQTASLDEGGHHWTVFDAREVPSVHAEALEMLSVTRYAYKDMPGVEWYRQNIPAASFVNKRFVATNSGRTWWSDGTTWSVIARAPKRFDAGNQGGTYSPDLNEGNIYSFTLTGNVAFGAPVNMQIGDELTFVMTQDATGYRTPTWNTVYKLPAAYRPDRNIGATTVITFRYTATNRWEVIATPSKRVHMGEVGYGEFGYWGIAGAEAVTPGTDYGFALTNTGDYTLVNAKTGGQVEFRINNSGIAKVDSRGLSLWQSGNAPGGAFNRFFVHAAGCAAGDVCVIDTVTAGRVTSTTTAASSRVVGVALDAATAANGVFVAIAGVAQVNVNTAAVAIGDLLVTSTTAGRAQASATPANGTILGKALSAKAAGSNGTVWCLLALG